MAAVRAKFSFFTAVKSSWKSNIPGRLRPALTGAAAITSSKRFLNDCLYSKDGVTIGSLRPVASSRIGRNSSPKPGYLARQSPTVALPALISSMQLARMSSFFIRLCHHGVVSALNQSGPDIGLFGWRPHFYAMIHLFPDSSSLQKSAGE